jgi:hypothetical protein
MQESTCQMTKAPKTQYSEEEAASMLGLNIDQLRSLVRAHIAKDEETAELSSYQPSDLVVLRVLAGRSRPAEIIHI